MMKAIRVAKYNKPGWENVLFNDWQYLGNGRMRLFVTDQQLPYASTGYPYCGITVKQHKVTFETVMRYTKFERKCIRKYQQMKHRINDFVLHLRLSCSGIACQYKLLSKSKFIAVALVAVACLALLYYLQNIGL